MDLYDKDKQNFKTYGHVLIKDYFTIDESKKIVEYADNLFNWREEAGKWMIYFEKDKDGNKKKCRIENFINYYPEIDDLLKNKLNKLADYLVGDEMVIFKEKLNCKIGGGKGFSAHQDHPAWTDFPPSLYVSISLFADNSTVDNGCLEFSNYKHNYEELSHDMINNGQLDKRLEEQLVWNKIETTSRDVLIFDSFSPHRSGDNKTDNNRRIFYFTFNKKSEGEYYQDYLERKRKELPPDIERQEGVTYNIKNSKYNLANPIE